MTITTQFLTEPAAVCIQYNDLTRRFKALSQPSGSTTFRIAQTGFGNGRLFLALAQHWLEHAPAQAQLHYMAFEPRHLHLQDEPQSSPANPLADALRAHCPNPLPGWHDVWLAEDKIRLTLWLGDVQRGLQECDGANGSKVGAWWLDANDFQDSSSVPSPALYQQMARLSHATTTFVSMGATDAVRDGLNAAGFLVQSATANANELDTRLESKLCFGQLRQTRPFSLKAPWFARPEPVCSQARHAIVVGAGLAGASAARALANAGWQVTVLEADECVASQASGNLAGTVHPLITADWNLRSQWYLQGFEATLRALQPALQRGQLRGELNGLIQLLVTQTSLERVQDAFRRVGLPPSLAQWQSAQQASQTLGTLAAVPGVFFPQGGWLHPQSVVNFCLAHPAIAVKTAHSVTDFRRTDVAEREPGVSSESNTWTVITPTASFTAHVLVFATGGLSSELNARLHLPIRPVKGQVTHLSAAQQTTPLKCPVTHAGYSSPCGDGLAVTGATFEAPGMSQILSMQGHDINLSNAAAALPEWLKPAADMPSVPNALNTLSNEFGRIAFRPTTPDHLPIMGAVPDWDWMNRTYLSQSHTHAVYRYAPQRYQPGLFVSNGHGPRGLMSVFLAAESIVADVQGHALVQPLALYHASHPARFAIRAWRSGQSTPTVLDD